MLEAFSKIHLVLPFLVSFIISFHTLGFLSHFWLSVPCCAPCFHNCHLFIMLHYPFSLECYEDKQVLLSLLFFLVSFCTFPPSLIIELPFFMRHYSFCIGHQNFILNLKTKFLWGLQLQLCITLYLSFFLESSVKQQCNA